MKFISKTTKQIFSPIDTLIGMKGTYKGPLKMLDLTQGIPNYGPPKAVLDDISKSLYSEEINHYTSRAGLEELRILLAKDISESYKTHITLNEVLITAGCNQAFTLAISTLINKNKEVIIPVPYYFNHHMWLEMEGIKPVYLFTKNDFIPNPEIARSLITQNTKAIILVNPGNPTGIIIPSDVISKFAELAREYNIILIIDETYRNFLPTSKIPHKLFLEDDWRNNIISLHSFSKDYALSGFRIGAIICQNKLILEMMKIFECITVCAPHISQKAAIASLKYGKESRNRNITEMKNKEDYFKISMRKLSNKFDLMSSGVFFGWIKHHFENYSSSYLVKSLLEKSGILCLPGTIFAPKDEGFLRFSISNLSLEEIDDLIIRLDEFNI
ncbi:MAG TPA: aminotransferase [Saprospiraceae bacterium]|nr:aminotransferase [Saprospiraceae bacterium]